MVSMAGPVCSTWRCVVNPLRVASLTVGRVSAVSSTSVPA